ncbi:glycosyltransferase [Salinimicrobium sp. 3283s]|uniref:glycosyltransferase n=1 Tax=Salinimicrobium sp. 3283s TaxID=3114359 RepID=UPI0031E529A5
MKKIALFIPCYNEENRLKIAPFQKFIKANKGQIDFYFINDGSLDNTGKRINDNLVDEKTVFLIQLNKNLGKGNALREGIISIKDKEYHTYGFIDADMDIPLEQILKLYNNLIPSPYLMAISSRDLYRSIKISRFRSLSSVAMVFIANHIIQFKPELKDTQCGCKLFKSELLDICFKDPFISEWLFDIELFLRIKKDDPKSREKICEVPLRDLEKSGKSGFKIVENFKIFRQLYQINKHYR